MKSIISKLLLIITLIAPFGIIHTGAGYAACVLACELACTGTAIIPVAMPAYLACAAACPGWCAPAALTCFSSNTQITVFDGKVEVEKNIGDVVAGDLVLTLVNGEPQWTNVVVNQKSVGAIQFVSIKLQGDDGSYKTLMVTPQHGIIVLEQNQNVVVKAQHVQLGHQMIAQDGSLYRVVEISEQTLDAKYTLQTSEGTVLASNVLTSTMCDEEITSTKQDLASKLTDWKARHKFN